MGGYVYAGTYRHIYQQLRTFGLCCALFAQASEQICVLVTTQIETYFCPSCWITPSSRCAPVSHKPMFAMRCYWILFSNVSLLMWARRKGRAHFFPACNPLRVPRPRRSTLHTRICFGIFASKIYSLLFSLPRSIFFFLQKQKRSANLGASDQQSYIHRVVMSVQNLCVFRREVSERDRESACLCALCFFRYAEQTFLNRWCSLVAFHGSRMFEGLRSVHYQLDQGHWPSTLLHTN